MQSAKKTEKTKKPTHVEVTFAASPQKFLHFNRFQIQTEGVFLELSLWYLDRYSGSSLPVFRGIIWEEDFRAQIPQLKRYIEKVGASKTEGQPPSRQPLWEEAPIAFNNLDCVLRGQYAEIVIRNFSHKLVTEAALAATKAPGSTHGAYISDGNIHRQLIVELINEVETSK